MLVLVASVPVVPFVSLLSLVRIDRFVSAVKW
jgi:hypothetical protein